MKPRKLSKRDQKIQYIWQQIESWLTHRFKLPIQIEVDVKTGLLKQYKVYSLTIFQNNQFYVYIDNRHLTQATKDDLLNIVGREALKIKYLAQGVAIKETDARYKKELQDYGLPYYDIFPQDGLALWEYRCIKCDKIITLSPKKLPKSANIIYNPKKLTDCCQAMIKESDVKTQYTNEECQKWAGLLKM